MEEAAISLENDFVISALLEKRKQLKNSRSQNEDSCSAAIKISHIDISFWVEKIGSKAGLTDQSPLRGINENKDKRYIKNS